jgi:NAD(P)-dependent dehydrogenase (short-subunit alcohol dehydrogenase family)
MRGKTVVITGGTSGIGEVAAVALAKMGSRIVLVARDKSRGDARGFSKAEMLCEIIGVGGVRGRWEIQT